ncbi:MAG: aspartate-semialdehyde dehydrogenase [bacterium]|nr:aspartate-semialdehyde dehydrogenase [bacterium]
MKTYRVVIAGATGAVGAEMITTLEQRNFPVASLRLLASTRSVGKKLKFKGTELVVEELTHAAFQNTDIVLSSTSGTLSKEFSPSAVKAGAIVVDNTSAYRMDPQVPLVVPEVNPQDVATHHGIIANPNCSTIIALVPLWPLHKAFGITRFIACTYQAVSGAGAWGIYELEQQTREVLAGKPATKQKFPHPIAFNVFSHNSKIGANGYNEEETKMLNETRKIFHDAHIMISATCVRVPVFRAHSEALHVEFSQAVTPAQVRATLRHAPGVQLVENEAANHFPMPLEAAGQGDVLVGRIRQDTAFTHGIALFVSGDQLLKGAALNAVQIAELLVGKQP